MVSKYKIPRSIVESAIFSENRDMLCKDVTIFDNITNGVTFAIATKPEEFGFSDEDLGIRVVKTDGLEDIPPFTIYFKEYKNQIILLDIEVTKE